MKRTHTSGLTKRIATIVIATIVIATIVIAAATPYNWVHAEEEGVPPDSPTPSLLPVADSDRRGFLIGIGVGPSGMQGFGVEGIRGVGGSIFLRVGTVATPRLLWVLQLEIDAEPMETPDGESIAFERLSSLNLGAQYYLRRAISTRGGIGVSTLSRGIDPETQEVGGGESVAPSFYGALAYDVARVRRLHISIELGVLVGLHEGGAVSATSLRLAGTWY